MFWGYDHDDHRDRASDEGGDIDFGHYLDSLEREPHLPL